MLPRRPHGNAHSTVNHHSAQRRNHGYLGRPLRRGLHSLQCFFRLRSKVHNVAESPRLIVWFADRVERVQIAVDTREDKEFHSAAALYTSNILRSRSDPGELSFSAQQFRQLWRVREPAIIYCDTER